MPSKLIDNPSSIEEVANWVEFYVLVSQEDLSKAELQSHIEQSSGDEPDSRFIDDIWLELKRRQSLYGSNPPFKVEVRVVSPLLYWKSIPEYSTCLVLSIDGNSVESVKTGKLFERLSRKAVCKYLDGDAIIYGFPSKQTLRDIANKINETFVIEPSAHFKDRGVDIIGWKTFGDSRKSQTVVLIQCAAGFNWGKKLLNIPIDAWNQYIFWGSKPLKGFAAPVVVSDEVYNDIVTDAGLMFDRARIYQNTQYDYADDEDLKSDMIIWCEDKINAYLNS